jgi:MYXO-CTERM domain-containing protein
MMSKRISVFTLSAVLGGLVLGLPTPAAHGHGNNPKPDLSDTGPTTGPTIPPLLPWMLDPGLPNGGGNSGIGDSPSDQFGGPDGGTAGGPAAGNFGLRPLILGDVPPMDPGADATFGSGSLGIAPDDSFGGTGSFTPLPSGGLVPSPGTLALLGLAALTVRRRRRK